jgi:hypothetical protein
VEENVDVGGGEPKSPVRDPHNPPQLVSLSDYEDPIPQPTGEQPKITEEGDRSSEEELNVASSREHWSGLADQLRQEMDSPLLSPTPLEKVQLLTTGKLQFLIRENK